MSVKLWNKLGSDAEVGASPIGPNGLITGTLTYSNAKFGKGIDSSTTSNYARFPSVFSGADGSAWTIRGWWTPSFSSGSTTRMCIFSLEDSADLGWKYITVHYSVGVSARLIIWCRNERNSPSGSIYYFNPSFTAGNKYHIAITGDASAGANAKIKLYLDGTPITLDGIYAGQDNTWSFSNPLSGYSVGISQFVNSNSITDNIYCDNSVLTDFSNRFWEDETGIPTGVVASQGTYPNKVTINWDDMSAIADLTSGGFRVLRATTSGGSYSDISGLLSGATLTYDDTTGVTGTHYFYKIESITVTATSIPSTYFEGWSQIAVITYPIVNDAPKSIISPKVLILNNLIDISNKVSDYPDISQKKGFMRSSIIQNEINITAKNYQNDFSADNPVSMLNGLKWRFQPIQTYDDKGNLSFSGLLKDFKRNHNDKTVSILACDLLAQSMQTSVIYVSADWETPADAIKNILTNYGIAFDARSVNGSASVYALALCYIKCNFTFESNMTIQKSLEEIANMCGADCYTWNNKIYFSHYIKAPSVVTPNLISVSDMYDLPTVETDEQILVNDYSVGYTADGGTPITDANGNNIGASSRLRYGSHSSGNVSGRTGDVIEIKDLTSAIYLGEALIRRSQKSLATIPQPLQKITFSVSLQFKTYLDLQTYFRMTFADESWTQKLFNVFGLTVSMTTNTITVEAYEVEE